MPVNGLQERLSISPFKKSQEAESAKSLEIAVDDDQAALTHAISVIENGRHKSIPVSEKLFQIITGIEAAHARVQDVYEEAAKRRLLRRGKKKQAQIEKQKALEHGRELVGELGFTEYFMANDLEQRIKAFEQKKQQSHLRAS